MKFPQPLCASTSDVPKGAEVPSKLAVVLLGDVRIYRIAPSASNPEAESNLLYLLRVQLREWLWQIALFRIGSRALSLRRMHEYGSETAPNLI
jgi:hypothetical protein